MVFGDTIGVALMAARNLSKEEYAANHPTCRIGKSLIFKVKDVMKKQEELPVCKERDLIMDQLVELTSKGCGCLLVVDEQYHLIGIFSFSELCTWLNSWGYLFICGLLYSRVLVIKRSGSSGHPWRKKSRRQRVGNLFVKVGEKDVLVATDVVSKLEHQKSVAQLDRWRRPTCLEST